MAVTKILARKGRLDVGSAMFSTEIRPRSRFSPRA